jgi:hypothetical protein
LIYLAQQLYLYRTQLKQKMIRLLKLPISFLFPNKNSDGLFINK